MSSDRASSCPEISLSLPDKVAAKISLAISVEPCLSETKMHCSLGTTKLSF